jgi:hypothetical protein
MHAAALDRSGSVKGGPYSEGAFPGDGQFGLMTIQDDGVSPVCMAWSGRDRLDNELVAWSTCASTAPAMDTDGDGAADVSDCARCVAVDTRADESLVGSQPSYIAAF